MNAHAGYYVGADGQSYPEVAAHAVQSVHAQHQSPFYGYIRSGISQKIYLFPTLEDTRAWFGQHVQLQPDHDYAAAFAATDLRVPIAGMEHFMRANVSGDYVGSWLPFLLGLPLGGLGGYFLRRWQEQHPGQALPFVPPGKLPAPQIPPTAVSPPLLAPKTSGDPWLMQQNLIGQGYDDGYNDGYGYSVGCPPVGGPWLDLTGQDGYAAGQAYDEEDDDGGGYSVGCPPWVGAQSRSWAQTKALIDAAIAEVMREAAKYPSAEAYVWFLAPPPEPYSGRAPGSVIVMEPTTIVAPFSSQAQALGYMRDMAQTRPAALAMFERSSKHWPNPTAWRTGDQPEDEQVIAQHVARQAQPTQSSGVGAEAGVDSAVNEVRRRARQLAERRAGNVIGVIHTSKDNLWHVIAFRSADDADDWLNTATQDQNAYTYAAYFDKEGESWPQPYIEKIGGFRQPKSQQRSVGEWMP